MFRHLLCFMYSFNWDWTKEMIFYYTCILAKNITKSNYKFYTSHMNFKNEDFSHMQSQLLLVSVSDMMLHKKQHLHHEVIILFQLSSLKKIIIHCDHNWPFCPGRDLLKRKAGAKNKKLRPEQERLISGFRICKTPFPKSVLRFWVFFTICNKLVKIELYWFIRAKKLAQ